MFRELLPTKRKLILTILFTTILFMTACGAEKSVRSEKYKVLEQQQLYQENQPIPSFTWSLERAILIQLYQMRNDALSTYTIVTSSFGNELWECPSIGYPIPADTQLTNPEQYYNGTTLKQAEPNGLFSSTNTVGTWVLCVLENGEVYPVYTEMNANTFPFVVSMDENGVIRNIENNKPVKTIKITK